MPVSFVLAYAHPVTDREEHEKHLFLSLWKYRRFTHDSVCPYSRWITVKRQMGHNYALLLVVSNNLQNLSSKG